MKKHAFDFCIHCAGTGKPYAKQMASTYYEKNIRTIDTVVICSFCKGRGFIDIIKK